MIVWLCLLPLWYISRQPTSRPSQPLFWHTFRRPFTNNLEGDYKDSAIKQNKQKKKVQIYPRTCWLLKYVQRVLGFETPLE
ncbi:uncharacterized protein F4807DRAFT_434409 [Annulohypoxylon truncatum]|uniref:uncharacterized protein n=1 Tax=Annulohypoxylon truncatum TaxID=327061 RepID=UPI00200833F1|nr:uncharacterized protein F4807DRAFT_434409 [Annulohypoxylon truncatum]KAI1207745.1 hypothetical protein F4807DRAFT_434409 [Annulohypoxylon truncatum]